jgi:RimJ/RimL family protein N-acetyltransferase
MDARQLMRLHVAALFAQDADGRLVVVNEPNGRPAPRFFFGRTAQGNAWWARHDLDEALADELEAVCRAESVIGDLVADPALVERLSAILTLSAHVERVWVGPAFVCPESSDNESAVRVDRTNADLLSPYLEDWRVDAEEGVPMAVSLKDGRAVSVCCSVRLSDGAHEAGVETHSDFRGRGHGARAVAEWANAVRGLERVPLYSTSWENESSRRLAARLGLVQFGADLHIT